MKDYRQFLIDTQNDEKLSADINIEVAKLAKIYRSKTDRELLTIAAKAHGYQFDVIDILNTKVVIKTKK